MNYQLLLSVLGGIACLLLLVLYFRLPAFLALLITCIVSSLIAGIEGEAILKTMQQGIGSTLGYVATVVGLGAIFGAILEKSGGALSIAAQLLKSFGEKRAPLSLALTGLLISIPVFFEVGFILLVPILYAVQQRTGRSVLLYAIPLLAGLAYGHAFIPPTPGPIAVANILGAKLGQVILIAFLIGLPVVLISGIVFGKYIANRIQVIPEKAVTAGEQQAQPLPAFKTILSILLLPMLLIFAATAVQSGLIPVGSKRVYTIIETLGHPFTALIVANLAAWYVLGIRRGYSNKELMQISTQSMASVGTIILLIGAGGAFKEVLVQTGAGKMLAEALSNAGMPVIVFAYIAAALMRILQGSATVAMITAAGLAAPFVATAGYSQIQLAALTAAIAAGGSVLSHVNDGGFWLIKQYLGLTEKQTFRSWSVMTTILSLTGFIFACLIFSLAS